jgi:subfamily B ATP-binding cassette protein HlyB/CyaB
MSWKAGQLENWGIFIRRFWGVYIRHSQLVASSPERISKTPLPAIAEAKDGSFFIIGRLAGEKLVVICAPETHLRLIDRNELEERWSGKLIMIARRAGVASFVGMFDLRWFISAVHRYRRVLGEVLLASFFLQLLGLLSPVFFQVVVDKVLVHRGLSTLDVLMVGLACVSVFEVALGAVRTFVFSHTTNRIDVELGARLFNHLLALPIAYFSTRRVGDSIARVRELENIRSFLTGSALTLTIDLFFTFVFFGVMFLYSATLTLIVIASLPVYVAISVVVTPIFRRRLDERFARGAENQAFLVETVTGVETLKAMAVEPHMQRRWEEQLAHYVHASALWPRRKHHHR